MDSSLQNKLNELIRETNKKLEEPANKVNDAQLEIQRLNKLKSIPFEVNQSNKGMDDQLRGAEKYYLRLQADFQRQLSDPKKSSKKEDLTKMAELCGVVVDNVREMLTIIAEYAEGRQNIISGKANDEPEPKEKKETPKKETPKKETPKKEAPKKSLPKKETPKKETPKPELLKDVPEKYYKQIFAVLDSTVVLGSEYKYNTLENLRYQVENADVKKLNELGIPVTSDPKKAQLIKDVLMKFIDMSREIRKDQWKLASNDKKTGKYEARKGTLEDAIVNRNERLVELLGIDRETAKKYGISLSREDLLKKDEEDHKLAQGVIEKARQEENFVKFYNSIQGVYKLGDGASVAEVSLNSIYRQLTSENNPYGLEGEALEAAKELVRREIVVRRKTWQQGKKQSQTKIDTERENLTGPENQ